MNRLKSPTASLTLLPLASLASLLALTVTALGVTGCAEDGAPEDGGIVVDEGPTDEDEPAAQEPAEDARITGVLVGEGGLTYDIDGGERDDWGPAAYLVDERGLNWIADGPGNKILVVDDEGSIVDTYLLDGLVRRIEDIAVTPTHVYILDTGLTQPTISRVGRSDAGGAAWESFAMPADVGDRAYITGLRADFDGTIALELGLGTSYYELFSPDGEYIGNKGAGPQVVHRVGERSVELIGYSGEPEDDESVGAVLVDGVQVATVTTAGMLGGFTFVTANADDEFWLRVQDVAVAGEEFRVRDFAYRMSLTGEILEIVQMPIEGEAVYVYNRLAFDLEGNPRALTTQPEEVVLAVPQASSPSAVGTLPAGTSESLEVLASAAPSADDVDDDDDDADAGSSRKECLTGAEIITRAHEYANYTATYSSSNLDNTCAGRKRPGHQVGVPISGVIYRYAGCQQLSTYDAAVKAGKVVGDVKASYGVAQCANGVDCSGFVSQTWQHSYHQTYNMDKISTVIDRKDVIPGDAMNKPHKHVRLIEQNLGSNNFMIVESTTGGYDRVVRRIISWGNNNGYKAIRYQGHCGYYGEAPDPMDPPPMDPPPMDPPPWTRKTRWRRWSGTSATRSPRAGRTSS